MAHKVPSAGDETLVSLTECGICLSEMENPKALPCLHSFCLECLKKVHHPPGIFICPLCKERIILPPGGVGGLRNNFFINQLKDWKAIQTTGELKPPCVCCKSTDQDTKARCVDCNGFLCQQCISSHKTLAPLAGHKIFTIDELRPGQIDMSQMKKEETCQTHKDQVLRWFCKTCNIPICRDCTVIDHASPDHDYIPIESEGQIMEIMKLMSNCKGMSKLFTDAIEETEEVKSNLNKAVDNIKIELEQERKAYMEAIQRSYEENMEKLAQIQKEKLEKIKSTQKGFESTQLKLSNALEIASQVIQSGSNHDGDSNSSILCATLTKLQDSKPSGISRSVGVIKFKPNQKGREKMIDIGKVSTGEGGRFRDRIGRWIFEKDIGMQGDTKSAYGIAVSPNKSFLVADCGSKSIKIFDQEGKLNQEKRDNLKNPINIVMASSGFYVADTSSFIKRFRHDGNYVMQFPAIALDGKASNTDGSYLYGVATDNDDNILVGNHTKKYISKHTPDGTHISSFPIGINPWFLKVTANGSVVVTPNQPNVPAHILDPNGKLLHTINKPTDAKQWHPAGVACSGDGSVFIASFGHGIYHFTEDGEYLGCVISDVHQAIGLDLCEDQLVIAHFGGIPAKIYIYQEG